VELERPRKRLGGLPAGYSAEPLRRPFQLSLGLLAVAIGIVLTLPETVRVRSRRPLTLRLEVPPAEREVFWRVLVPSGMLFSLFDGVALSLVPVFEVRELGVTNYALVGAAGFLVLVSGAISQVLLPWVPPQPAIQWGLVVATIASVGIVIGAPLGSTALVLVSVAVTGAACGMVFKGGSDLCTQIAPPEDRGKLISSYYVACYLGGFSVPPVVVGLIADATGNFLPTLQPTTNLSITVSPGENLQLGHSYDWAVNACNGSLCATFGNWWTFTTAATPGAPLQTGPANGSTNLDPSLPYLLSWNKPAGAISGTTTYTVSIWDPQGDPDGHLLGDIAASNNGTGLNAGLPPGE